MGSPRMPLKLGPQLIVAARAAALARTHLELWGVTAGFDSRDRLLEPIEEFWEPLRFIEHGQLVAYCVTICTIYDKRRDAIRLQEICRQLGCEDKVIPLLARLAQVKHLRNNIFAHRSINTTWEATFEEAALTPNIMHELAEGTFVLANDLLKQQGLDTVAYHSLPRKEYERLLKGGLAAAVRSIWNDIDDDAE